MKTETEKELEREIEKIEKKAKKEHTFINEIDDIIDNARYNLPILKAKLEGYRLAKEEFGYPCTKCGKIMKHQKEIHTFNCECGERIWYVDRLGDVTINDVRKEFNKKVEDKFDLEFLESDSLVKEAIKSCEGKHIQQVCYSTYHDALTQICFNCRKIKTSINKEEIDKIFKEEKSK